MVVLVGGSSTGKTRALWEAVQSLPAGWRIWQPIGLDPTETLLRALAEGQIAPRTVLWLDDLDAFLSSPSGGAGRTAASGLRELLSDPGRGPVLILGTLWPEDWDVLTANAAHGQPDPHSQARALLELAATIRVPDEFSAEDLGKLADASGRDPRLALAAAQAGAKVTQFLAGIPELMRRYDMADTPARAVITAAIDAQRVGDVTRIPEAFLRGAAPGYMDDDTWNQLDDRSWFGEALAYAVRRSRGVSGPLEPIRPRPGEDLPLQPQYRPHDYLSEWDRHERRFVAPPHSFWDSVACDIHNPGDLLAFAGEARRRYYYRIADSLVRQAAANGDRTAVLRLAELLTTQGQLEEAISLQKQALETVTGDEADDTWQAVTLASQLEQAGRRDEATPWWQRAVEAVSRVGMSDLRVTLRNDDRLQEAELWLSDAAAGGSSQAAGALVTLLEGLGRYQDAITWSRRALEMGDRDASSSLFWLLTHTGQLDEAASVLDDADPYAAYRMMQLAGLLERAGRTADAQQWLRRAADLGNYDAISRFSSPLEQEGRFEEAAELWKASAEAGNWKAARNRLELLEKAGKSDQVTQILLSQAQAGDISAMFSAAKLLARAGKLEQAKSLLARANELGSSTARPEWRRLLYQAGHVDAVRRELESGASL
jgi:tetratricopeptide (TPR) repeat protein